jgi:hypothetical protein
VTAWRGFVNHDHPVLETELPLEGSRFEGVVAPVVRQSVFAIRLRPRKVFTLADYEAAEILTGTPLTKFVHLKGNLILEQGRVQRPHHLISPPEAPAPDLSHAEQTFLGGLEDQEELEESEVFEELEESHAAEEPH